MKRRFVQLWIVVLFSILVLNRASAQSGDDVFLPLPPQDLGNYKTFVVIAPEVWRVLPSYAMGDIEEKQKKLPKRVKRTQRTIGKEGAEPVFEIKEQELVVLGEGFIGVNSTRIGERVEGSEAQLTWLGLVPVYRHLHFRRDIGVAVEGTAVNSLSGLTLLSFRLADLAIGYQWNYELERRIETVARSKSVLLETKATSKSSSGIMKGTCAVVSRGRAKEILPGAEGGALVITCDTEERIGGRRPMIAKTSLAYLEDYAWFLELSTHMAEGASVEIKMEVTD